MDIFTKLYGSTSCNADYIADMAEEAAANGYKAVLPDKCGYILVAQRLVPWTFLSRLQGELDGHQFEYGAVLSETTVFRAGFMQSLTADERDVLMPCVLVLIERGDFGLNFFAANEEKVLATA